MASLLNNSGLTSTSLRSLVSTELTPSLNVRAPEIITARPLNVSCIQRPSSRRLPFAPRSPSFNPCVRTRYEADRMFGFFTKATAVEEAQVEDHSSLKEGIATFYDASSGLWEDMWGEHMHHGYYPSGEKVDHRQAQIDMIENTLSWAGIPEDEASRPRTVVDVGCGIGGSARHLARKYGAAVTAITLSPVQAQRGNAICTAQGLDGQVALQVADALEQPFSDGSFDLIWSMESGEHMPNKTKFVGELARVASPGGRIIIVTWCHRDLQEGETSLTSSELALLDRICSAYYLPAWCSVADYVKLAEEAGLQDVRTADWTEYITPFWPAVISSALSVKGFLGLLQSGWTTMRGALAMALMVQGYQKGLIKFGLITARKPV